LRSNCLKKPPAGWNIRQQIEEILMTKGSNEMTETYLTVFDGCDFSGSKHTNQDRLDALVNYMVLGTYAKAGKATGIPASTIRDWARTDWWAALSAEVRSEKEDEFRAGFTEIIVKAIDQAKDALEHGEVKLVKTKDGYEERRVPVGAKDSVMVAAISYDKLRLSENKATSITETSSSGGIQAKLEELSKRLEEKNANVVSEQQKEK
jgi:hypothetical protein